MKATTLAVTSGVLLILWAVLPRIPVAQLGNGSPVTLQEAHALCASAAGRFGSFFSAALSQDCHQAAMAYGFLAVAFWGGLAAAAGAVILLFRGTGARVPR